MTVRSFETFTEASTFAKKIARTQSAPVKITRRGTEYVVEIHTTLASASIQQPDRRQNQSTSSSKQTTSFSSTKISHSAPPPIAPQRVKKLKKKRRGLSAAAAKRTSPKKGEKFHNLRSIFITKSIKPKVISGGLPSLGKRK